MASKITNDPRIDPRLKKFSGRSLKSARPGDVASREQLLAEEQTDAAKARIAMFEAMSAMCDNEQIAPSKGLKITTETFRSEPDGNIIKIQYIRPDTTERLPCVYYIHGGGMQFFSCFDGMYKAWGRVIAAQGVAVLMVDFRNAIRPSSAPEVAPFPAGLNDCVSGVRWVAAHADRLNIDPQRIIVAGESGGGNLTLATGLKLKRNGDIGVIKGLYALCPYIAGEWPLPQNPSSTENNGILLDLHNNRGAMAYGIEAFLREEPSGLAELRDRRRREGPAANSDPRERMRSATRRGHQLLSPADQERHPRALPPSHGHHARHSRSSRSLARTSATTRRAT